MKRIDVISDKLDILASRLGIDSTAHKEEDETSELAGAEEEPEACRQSLWKQKRYIEASQSPLTQKKTQSRSKSHKKCGKQDN